MRNSANEHNPFLPHAWHRVLLFIMPIFTICLLLAPDLVLGDTEINVSSEDMVAIRAEEAWEDVKPDTIHFSGRFEMRIRDMILKANTASLFGRLENPDRLVLKGAPANFTLAADGQGRSNTIRAEAQEIIYNRESNWVSLNGEARLSQGDRVLSSIAIEYNIETDRFRTRDLTGVEINANTEN
jgi:lipopolysaccharide transport protein LptA